MEHFTTDDQRLDVGSERSAVAAVLSSRPGKQHRLSLEQVTDEFPNALEFSLQLTDLVTQGHQ